MIGEDLIFNGHYLSEYDMRMYSPEESQQYATTNYDSGEITSLRSRPNYYSITYNEQMTLNFFICKDACLFDDQSDMAINGDEMNLIRSWIESPKLPTELVVLGDGDSENTHYYGVFTSVQPFMIESICYGLTLTFTCNAPYGYSDVHNYTFTSSSTKKIINTSAEWKEYIKPIITVTSSSQDGFTEGETLVITNQSDSNKTMTLTLPSGKKKLIIDCEKKYITDENGNLIPMSALGVTLPSVGNYNFISTPSFSFYWLSLVPFSNTVAVEFGSSVAKVVVSAKYILKSGGL